MKPLSVKLGVIFIGLVIFSCAEGWGADWKFYGNTDDVLAYYDTQSITRQSKNIIRVWVKWDYKKKGVLYYVENFGEKYENLSLSKDLWEINCVGKKLRNMSMTFYDNKGDIIDSSDSPSEWNFIIPESTGEFLYKEVCK